MVHDFPAAILGMAIRHPHLWRRVLTDMGFDLGDVQQLMLRNTNLYVLNNTVRPHSYARLQSYSTTET
jgi:hypothetical protein